MAACPGEHRRLDCELEQVLFLARRLYGEGRAFVGELPRQRISDRGQRYEAGDARQIEGVFVVLKGVRVK